ncbi:DUF3137 domain-containing protein [Candidatus Saccharibacteria bacterium]|nr:DUF3137 domain-containing protein [Candidatus Saccharibacteria bacterium]
MQFQEVENARKQYYAEAQLVSKKRKKVTLITFLIVLAAAALFCALNYGNISNTVFRQVSYSPFFIIIPAFFFLTFGAIISAVAGRIATSGSEATKKYIAYKHAYKGYFIARQLAAIFTDLEYDHRFGLNKNVLSNTKLIYTGDRYSSNDFVRGKYKQVGFMQADVKIEEKVEEKDKNGHTNTYFETIFKGRYLVFEFPKKFEFKMVVSHQGYGQWYTNPKTGRGLNRIETESPEFNKKFLVYAEDGFEAFYILDPAFLDNLEKLGQKYGDQLALYFSDNQMIIGLNDGGDAFEPPDASQPINEQTENAKVTGEMKLITELVDSLKLDR